MAETQAEARAEKQATQDAANKEQGEKYQESFTTASQPQGAGTAAFTQDQIIESARREGLTDAQGNVRLDLPPEVVRGLNPYLQEQYIARYNKEIERAQRKENLAKAQTLAAELKKGVAEKEAKAADLKHTLQVYSGSGRYSNPQQEELIRTQSEIAGLKKNIGSLESTTKKTESALEAHKRIAQTDAYQAAYRKVGGSIVPVGAMSPETEYMTRPSVTKVGGAYVPTSVLDTKSAESLGWGTLGQPKTEPQDAVPTKFQSVDMSTPRTLKEQVPKYTPGEASLEHLKGLAQDILTPKPIFSDIFLGGPTKAEIKAIEFVQNLFHSGPTLLGSTIEQIAIGKPLTGTGRGLGYDIESGVFDVITILAPTKKIPISSSTFKAIAESGKVKTIIRTVDVGVGSKTKTILTKTEGGISVGKPTKKGVLEKSALKEIEPSDRGLEFSTQGKLGSKILTSEEGMAVLVKAGKMLPRDVEAVKLEKELVGLIKISAKEVPPEIRQKASVIPERPLSSLEEGAESKALTEEIIPRLEPIKGTLAETLQLEESLLKPFSKGSLTANLGFTPSTKTAEYIARGINIRNVVPEGYGFGQPSTKRVPDVVYHGIAQRNVEKGLRDATTKDIDVDYIQKVFGTQKAHQVAKRSTDILNKVVGKGRTFEKQGTNVVVKTKEGKETVLNILTKKDEKAGYLNKGDKRPFEINLKKRIVKVKTPEGKTGKFVSIEQQALNRIESSLSLQGPKSDKFRGIGSIPYLKPGMKIQTTEKGYTVLPTEHRFKDISKLVSQDVEQIARNLKAVGREKEGTRALEIKERLKTLYPEIDFGKFDFPKEFGTMSYPSKLESLSSVGKEIVGPSATLGLQLARVQTIEPKTKVVETRTSFGKSAIKPANKSAYKGSATKTIYGSKISKSDSSLLSKPQSVRDSSGSKSSLSKSKTDSVLDSVGSKTTTESSSSKSASKLSLSTISPSVSSTSKGSSSKGSTGSTISTGSSVLTSKNTLGEKFAIPILKEGKIIPIIKPFGKTRIYKPFKEKDKPRADFLGNTRVSEIMGVFKRPDILYGRKKTSKLVSVDVLGSSRGKFTKTKKSPLGSKATYFFSEKPKKGKKKIKTMFRF